MRYDEVKGLPLRQFKHLTGVKQESFTQMLAVIQTSERQKKRSGRPSKLALADQLLLTLMYWCEYRTHFHIAKSYGIYKANANRFIRKVERALAISAIFSLLGKRAARSDKGAEISSVIVDVTETYIEKKKSNDAAIAGRTGRCRFAQDAAKRDGTS